MKSKLQLLLICILSLPSILNAQNYVYEWASGLGGGGNDRGHSITVDALGNVIITGQYNGTVDFDPGPGTFNLISQGGEDVFIQKLDANGNFIWAKGMGGPSSDSGFSTVVDSLGNIYTTGFFQNSVDFDPGAGTAVLNSFGNEDIFIQKMDANGNFLWAERIGGSFDDIGNYLVHDTSGYIYVTGSFSSGVDFDSGLGTTILNSVGQEDVFVLKLDVDGNFVWVNQIGGILSDFGTSIDMDHLGNIFSSGYFSDTAYVNPGTVSSNLISEGGFDIFIQKMDANGNSLWAKQMGGTSFDKASSLEVDISGNVLTTGQFSGSVDFDPGVGINSLTALGPFDIFVQKMDPNGTFVWAKGFGGSFPNSGSSIALDASGNSYTTGAFGGIADFDPGTGTTNFTSNGGRDIFIQKMNANGDFVWAEQMGGSLTDAGSSITTDDAGNVYTTGIFSSTVDFEFGPGITNLISEGGVDVFVQKITPCVITGTDVISACSEFTWIDGITYSADNDTSTFNLVGASVDGCDSLVTLDLSILNPSTGLDSRTECSPYVWIDGIAYTSDNDTATFNIVGGAANGCDSLVTLDLSILNPSTGLDSRTECSPYVWIDGIAYTSDNDTATFNIVGGATNGCDSLVTLDLTINNVNTNTTVNGATITSDATGSTYQWLDCENGMNIIPGETNQSLTPAINGVYAVEINENGCLDTSSCVVITTVGILENTFNDSFRIAPNPNKGLFTIQFDQTQAHLSVQLFSISGQAIENFDFHNTGSIEIELIQPSGVYLLEVKGENGKSAVLRIVKE